MKSKQNKHTTTNSINNICIKLEQDLDVPRNAHLLNPPRIQKVCKLKHVLIPPSKIRLSKIPRSKIPLSKMPFFNRKSLKREFIAHPRRMKQSVSCYALDKKRDFYNRHEAIIKEIYKKRSINNPRTLYLVLIKRIPHTTLEFAAYSHRRVKQSSPPPLYRHQLFDSVRSAMHQEYLAALLKEHPWTPKYQLLPRLCERFPDHSISRSLVEGYYFNMSQFDKSSKIPPLREAAFSQSEFIDQKKHRPISTKSIFFPEETSKYRRNAISKDKHQKELLTQDILLKYKKLEDGMTGPFGIAQFRFVINLIINNPELTVITYAVRLRTEFPELRKIWNVRTTCCHISTKCRELLRNVKEPIGGFKDKIKADHITFIKNQLIHYPRKNTHQIYTTFANEFPDVSTFSYNSIKTIIKNNIQRDEFHRRLPKLNVYGLSKCHERFLDEIYARLPNTRPTKAHSTLLIAFPEEYVSFHAVSYYIRHMILIK
ncbi:hypothetical protein K501DRAFT_333489 [Backusella circina FSU 941]|nr:hypothetical protein K501DRAFT_333489 [Backusella circina FSU 941]